MSRPSRSRITARINSRPRGTYPPPSVAYSGVGLAAGSVEFSAEADLIREVDEVKAIGCSWYRWDAKWENIEPSRGATLNFTITDRLINICRQRQMRILLSLVSPPSWATGLAPGIKAAPQNPADFASFAERVVAHTVPLGVEAFEIWNEPNLSSYWQNPSPSGYTALCQASYARMKAAGAPMVLVGVMSPAGGYDMPAFQVGQANVHQVRYIEACFAAGLSGYFDAVSHHPYPGNELPSQQTGWWGYGSTFRSTPSIRSTMNANGHSAKQLWGTEFGADLTSLSITEARQGDIIGNGLQDWNANRAVHNLGPLMVYAGKLQTIDGYDIFRSDWSRRPAATAVLNNYWT